MRNLESCIGMALSLEFVTTSIIYGSYNMRYIALEKATWCKKAKIFLFFNQHYYGLVKCSHKCHCLLLRLFVHGLIDLLLKKGRESTNILLVLIARGAPLLYWKIFLPTLGCDQVIPVCRQSRAFLDVTIKSSNKYLQIFQQ